MKANGASKGRNWQEYSESLVKRGEMYLTFDFLESWERANSTRLLPSAL